MIVFLRIDLSFSLKLVSESRTSYPEFEPLIPHLESQISNIKSLGAISGYPLYLFCSGLLFVPSATKKDAASIRASFRRTT